MHSQAENSNAVPFLQSVCESRLYSMNMNFNNLKIMLVCDSLGTPDTNLKGLNTLKARSAFTSKSAAFPPIGVPPSPFVACSNIALNNLWERETETEKESNGCYLRPLNNIHKILCTNCN